jgi:hypothetical protein
MSIIAPVAADDPQRLLPQPCWSHFARTPMANVRRVHRQASSTTGRPILGCIGLRPRCRRCCNRWRDEADVSRGLLVAGRGDEHRAAQTPRRNPAQLPAPPTYCSAESASIMSASTLSLMYCAGVGPRDFEMIELFPE